MKHFTSLGLLLAMSVGTLTAQPPGEPCCSIVGINPANNTVVAKNTTTGRLFVFKVDAMDIKAITLKDPVTTNGNLSTVAAVNGVARKYKIEPINEIKINKAQPVGKPNISNAEPAGLVQINYGQPCCSITDIRINNAQPCCNMVTAKNKTTGEIIRFKAPVYVARAVKVGDPVYIDPCCSFAIVQSSYQGGGQMNSFGYPIESGEGNSQENSTAKWVISPVTTMKGVLGRLNMNFPAGVDWNIWIYTQADNKMVNSFYQTHNTNMYNLSPGEYRLLLSNVPVENVPIQKGNETRLKAGFLNVISEGSWELYDELKEKFYASNTKPQKIALPVGSYYLKLGGQFYLGVIKDKMTVEY